MSGDWIKIEHVTPDKPEVFAIAEKLRIDPDAVLGKLMRFWMWADQQSLNGNIGNVSDAVIDRVTHQRGFAQAMRCVNWLSDIGVPNFERHNGATAKARAESNRRMTKSRAIRNNGDESDAANELNGCADVAEKAQQKAQPEKRREEKNKEIGTTGENTVNRMREDWRPSKSFETIAKQAGLSINQSSDYESQIMEFISYWLTQSRERLPAQWDHAFLQNLQAQKLKNYQPKPPAGSSRVAELERKNDAAVAEFLAKDLSHA